MDWRGSLGERGVVQSTGHLGAVDREPLSALSCEAREGEQGLHSEAPCEHRFSSGQHLD